MILSYITWDPSRGMFNFNLPILNRPILWYGFFFALGFFAGYLLLTYLLRRYFHHLGKDHIKQRTAKMAEQLTLYVVVGALVGARVGDVLFLSKLGGNRPRSPFDHRFFGKGGWPPMAAPSASSSLYGSFPKKQKPLSGLRSISRSYPQPQPAFLSVSAIFLTRKF